MVQPEDRSFFARVAMVFLLAACGTSAIAAQEAQPLPPASRPHVGLALGGGSARGLAHIGVLRWFEEHRIPIDVITARTTADFHLDMAALGTLPPDEEPRATDHIAEMISIIQRLIGSGHAYAAEGHVLFAVASDDKIGGNLDGAVRAVGADRLRLRRSR